MTKEIKGKSFSFDQFADKLKTKSDAVHPLDHDRSAKSDFHHYNILPIPALLTQVFLELEKHDPYNVAVAFFEVMYQFDSVDLLDKNDSFDQDTSFISNSDDIDDSPDGADQGNSTTIESQENETTKNSFEDEFGHILQFCQLCHTKKIPPVLYTMVDQS